MINSDLMKTAQKIVQQCMKEVEFLIKNADRINKLSDGVINLKKLDNFRDAITIVYMINQNNGILEHVKLDNIYTFLDKGFFNENQLDMFVYMNCVKYSK